MGTIMSHSLRATLLNGTAGENGTSSSTLLEMEQENARLRLILRELRHRSYNQWQLLIGLAEMESLQSLQTSALSCSVRLCTLAYAFTTLNRTLDANADTMAGDRQIAVRPALERILHLLQATSEEDALQFRVQDAWLSEKGCAALMLICTELVCNAAKFGRKRTELTFRVWGDRGILEVSDDGPGFPADFQVRKHERQGLQLVEALCHCDLDGEMRCHSDVQGGLVTVTFPVLPTPNLPVTFEAEEAFCSMEGVICFN
jgi:two-component sensor histidine kinase